MNKRLKNALVVLIPVMIILFIILGSYISKKIKAIPDNPADLAGNTAGNLYNGGTFCEQDGIVYFANPYDGGSIYAMDPDHGNIHKVVTANASFINTAGKYIYYYSASSAGQSGLGYIRDGRGIYRTNLSGTRNIILNNITSDSLMLLGNRLFYTRFGEGNSRSDTPLVTFNSMSTEGKDETVLLHDQIKTGEKIGTDICFAAMTGDHYLYRLEAESGNINKALEINMYEPTVSGEYVYYLDMDDNMSLKRCPLFGGEPSLLAGGRIETFNLYGDLIYYQTIAADEGSTYAFKRIRTDGSEDTVIKEGVVTEIQVTSTYVYFKDFNADMPIYCFPSYGGGSISVFSEASDAVKLP